MEAKAIFVQLVRSLPYFAKKPVMDLHRIAETAATSKDAQMVRKGIKVQDMLKDLEVANVIDRKDNYALLAQEIKQELVHLGDLKDRVMQESSSLESVYKTILDHNNYLKSQLESYKAYLQNVRIQSSGGEKGSKKSVGIGVEVEHSGKGSKSKVSKPQILGPYKFTHQQLEKDGVIAITNVPESR
jgi:Ras GTPase-activating-like protein IQGAP2/3